MFLYHQVLHKKLGHLGEIERPTRLKRLPTVLSHKEALRVLQHLKGMYRIMGGLLYGAGLLLFECVRLRVKDVDFASNQIVVREGKGNNGCGLSGAAELLPR